MSSLSSFGKAFEGEPLLDSCRTPIPAFVCSGHHHRGSSSSSSSSIRRRRRYHQHHRCFCQNRRERERERKIKEKTSITKRWHESTPPIHIHIYIYIYITDRKRTKRPVFCVEERGVTKRDRSARVPTLHRSIDRSSLFFQSY